MKPHIFPFLMLGVGFGSVAFPAEATSAGTFMQPALQAPEAIALTPMVSTGIPRLNAQELDQLMGPIALYPDALIALILPASTNPSDVVLAARYLQGAGEGPTRVEDQTWDDSVKALAHYPAVLKWMDENLEWTKQLGEAFVAQPADVMNAVQRLRATARAAGTLVDTPQQQVVAEADMITIVPAQPDVIYVPHYDPDIVYVRQTNYGYRPNSFFSFSVGYPVGFWLGYNLDWRQRRIWMIDHRERERYWHSQRDWRRPSLPLGHTWDRDGTRRPWTPSFSHGHSNYSQSRRPRTEVARPALVVPETRRAGITYSTGAVSTVSTVNTASGSRSRDNARTAPPATQRNFPRANGYQAGGAVATSTPVAPSTASPEAPAATPQLTPAAPQTVYSRGNRGPQNGNQNARATPERRDSPQPTQPRESRVNREVSETRGHFTPSTRGGEIRQSRQSAPVAAQAAPPSAPASSPAPQSSSRTRPAQSSAAPAPAATSESPQSSSSATAPSGQTRVYSRGTRD